MICHMFTESSALFFTRQPPPANGISCDTFAYGKTILAPALLRAFRTASSASRVGSPWRLDGALTVFGNVQVDHMITLAKDGSLHARRQAMSYIHDKELVHALFEQVRVSKRKQTDASRAPLPKLKIRPLCYEMRNTTAIFSKSRSPLKAAKTPKPQ